MPSTERRILFRPAAVSMTGGRICRIPASDRSFRCCVRHVAGSPRNSRRGATHLRTLSRSSPVFHRYPFPVKSCLSFNFAIDQASEAVVYLVSRGFAFPL